MAEAQQSESVSKQQTVINQNVKQASLTDQQQRQPPQLLPTTNLQQGKTSNAKIVQSSSGSTNTNQSVQQEVFGSMNNGGGLGQVQRERSFVRNSGQNMQVKDCASFEVHQQTIQA